MELNTVLLGLVVFFVLIILTCIYLLSWISFSPIRARKDLLQSTYVYCPGNSASEQFKSLLTYGDDGDSSGKLYCTKPDLYLSVIIPAMNEQVVFPVNYPFY